MDKSQIAIAIILALLGIRIIILNMKINTKKKTNKDILDEINGE